MPGRVRIVVVDRQPIFRQGMVLALNQAKELTVVGSGSTRCEALRLATLLRPDVLVLDIALIGSEPDDMSLAMQMREIVPAMKIIFLTPSADVKQAMAAMKLGVPGYVVKTVNDAQFCQIVREIHEGLLHINPDRTAIRLASLETEACRGDTGAGYTHVELTTREEQILSLLSFGLKNAEISRALGVTAKSVTYSISVILKKLKAKNRTQAVLSQQLARPRLLN